VIDPNVEVRYQMLRPGQVRARREACAIGYVPLGNLEWHGDHNPLGADTLQAEGLALLAAQRGGGLVFPPLWYGEPKRECMEYAAAERDQIAVRLGVETFDEKRLPLGASDAGLFYQQLLVMMLQQMEALGFHVAMLIAGHYPLIAHGIIAAQRFSSEARYRKPTGRAMVAAGVLEPELRFLLERVPAGDHGGKHETSNCLALHPQTVDLSLTRDREIVGAGQNAGEATAEYGRRNLEAAADLIAKEAQHRLQHPDWYASGSYVQQLGKWRERK
jgi:creatinine amidohydrolase